MKNIFIFRLMFLVMRWGVLIIVAFTLGLVFLFAVLALTDDKSLCSECGAGFFCGEEECSSLGEECVFFDTGIDGFWGECRELFKSNGVIQGVNMDFSTKKRIYALGEEVSLNG